MKYRTTHCALARETAKHGSQNMRIVTVPPFMVCRMSNLNLKVGLLNMQLWFSQSHPIHAEEPSIWDSGSKSIFDERAWMRTSRHLSAVVYHQHWRIPPLSHVIYSQPLYILSNLLSSPSR